MKIKSILCMVCTGAVVVTLTSCSRSAYSAKENPIKTESSTIETAEQTLDKSTDETITSQDSLRDKYAFFDSFDIVYEETENYKLLTNSENTGYCYYVYGNSGDLLDYGYHDYRDCGFKFKEGNLVYHNAGLTFAWYERYYDLENERVSKLYYRPLDTHANLVAYYGKNNDGKTVLIICDMFDKQTYYREFERNFSVSVLTGGSTGKFSENGMMFTVTYTVTDYENKTDTEITETLQLPQQGRGWFSVLTDKNLSPGADPAPG